MRSSFELYQRARLVGLRALGFRVPKALLVCVCAFGPRVYGCDVCRFFNIVVVSVSFSARNNW